MVREQFTGIILFTQNHREKDALVKVMTRDYGKRMFFVRDFSRPSHPLKAALQPFAVSHFVGTINHNGLSFLSEGQLVVMPKQVYSQLEVQASLSYIVALADAVVEDTIKQERLYDLLHDTIVMIAEGKDDELLTMLFELALLPMFGAPLQMHHCTVCQGTEHLVGYSLVNHGPLCQQHAQADKHLLPVNPTVLRLCQRLMMMRPTQLGQVNLKRETKQQMRQLIDYCYAEYVGIRLKSKSFLDSLHQWGENLDFIDKNKEI